MHDIFLILDFIDVRSITEYEESISKLMDDTLADEDTFPRGLPNPNSPVILIIGAPGSPKVFDFIFSKLYLILLNIGRTWAKNCAEL